jgi:FkbM family methyltransferase
VPTLCIEGHPDFLRALESNLGSLGSNVEVERCFAGDTEGSVNAEVRASEGTASLVTGGNGVKIPVRTVDAMAGARSGRTFKLLKIDTDGFDARILRGASALIARDHPAIFFEYDPDLLARVGDDGRDAIRALARAGYGPILAYDNHGRFLLHADAGNESLWNELHSYYTGRGGESYMDLCAFHASDAAIAEAVIRDELALNARPAQRG